MKSDSTVACYPPAVRTCRRMPAPCAGPLPSAHLPAGFRGSGGVGGLVRRWIVLILGLGVVWGAGALPVLAQGPSISEVEVGLGGKFKVGYWTPVHVVVEGGDRGFVGNIELTAPDSDDVTTRFTQGVGSVVQVPAGGQWTGWRYLKLGKIRGRIHVALRSADGTIAASRWVEHAPPEVSTCQWVVEVGSEVGLDRAAVYLARVRGERLTTSRLLTPAQFPDLWYGYEGVDALLVTTAQESPLEQLDDAQYAALLQWLKLGGRLVYSAGRRAPDIFREGNRFHALRPGEFDELDPYWKATGLEHYARATERLTSNDDAPLATFQQLRGTVACYEGAGGRHDRALVVQYAFGFGEIMYVGLDLEQSPLADWPARPRLLARLLQTRSEEEESAIGQGELGQVTHVGYDDLAGQLRSALDQYSQVTMVHFAWVAGLLVLYLLLLGPADFFALHRLGRPQWTWCTFPVIVLGFCVLAVWLSQRWQGRQMGVNQLDIVDVDLAQQVVRGTTWAGLYSPRAARLDMDLAPEPAVATTAEPGMLLSWLGLPGTGLGGMNTTGSVDVLRDEYVIASDRDAPRQPGEPRAAIVGLPIHCSASRSLLGRWWNTTGPLAPSQLKGADSGGLLEGLVVNPLDVSLSHCYVYYGNWAYPIEGRLEPGDAVELAHITPLDLKWHLSGRRVIESRDVSTPWDRADLSNLPRIAQMLMFYGAAGGRAYTRLTHSFLSYVDLSRHLRAGQAILVGRSKVPGSALQRSGQPLTNHIDQQWTFYRVSIPVEHSATESW